jgi:hypothetical protein
VSGKPLEKFFDQEIEPAARCGNCEYFDGGGLTPEGKPVSERGDCLNRASPHFTTDASGLCKYFFPCSTRWPDADHQ